MKSSILVNLGKQLFEIRKSTGLNAVEFFQKYLSGTERGRTLVKPGSMKNHMSKIENGEIEIPYEMLLRYSEIGNVSIDQLLRGEKFTPQEKDDTPRTLADILKMLFALQETSGLSNIGTKEATAGIYVSLPSSEIYNLDYGKILHAASGHEVRDSESAFNSAHGKAVLYGFFLRWSEMLEHTRKMKEDDPEMFQEFYSAWKEKTLKLASQYDVFGNSSKNIPEGSGLPIVEKLEDNLEKIFDPFGTLSPWCEGAPEFVPMPWNNARDLFK